MKQLNKQFYEELKENIQPYFKKSGSHAFNHTQRVYNLAVYLSKGERVDLDVIKASALLHDIARKEQDICKGKICHAERGAEISKRILREMNFPEDKIKEVFHAIIVHRQSKKLKPESKEAKILQDADRLDALGAITIGRMFSTGGEIKRPLHNPNIVPGKRKKRGYSETTINGFYEKILKLTPGKFHTKKAQEIAKCRYDFVEEFVNRFIKEWEGEL